MSSDNQCAACGEYYNLDEGSEPTDYCHPCAQGRVLELQRALQPFATAAMHADFVNTKPEDYITREAWSEAHRVYLGEDPEPG
jgi:hypothetical protein